MNTVRKKKKFLIHKIEVTQPEPYRQFEIKLPANVTKVTGIIITNTEL